ncbi:uncharacterized [Tachysurus ichikawai]
MKTLVYNDGMIDVLISRRIVPSRFKQLTVPILALGDAEERACQPEPEVVAACQAGYPTEPLPDRGR